MLIMITARISTKEQLDELHAIITKHPKISDWYRHMGNQWIVEFDDKSLSSLNNYLGAAFEDGKRPTMLVNTLQWLAQSRILEFYTKTQSPAGTRGQTRRR